MREEGTRIHVVATEPPVDPTAHFRDRLAARCADFDRAYPRALDLEARVLAGVHAALHGVAALVCGLYTPRRFREALMGERHLRLSDLCRLATEPTREARDAAREAVAVLAGALGFRLEPVNPATANAHDALAGFMESHTALSAEAVRALGDGNLTAAEACGLRPEVEAHKMNAARLEAVIAEAAARGRDGGR